MGSGGHTRREIFMGDIQGSTRMCADWHYPFLIEPLSPLGQQSVQSILAAINQKLNTVSEPSIHQATEQRIVISFFHHRDAVRAFRLWDQTSTLHINGMPYRFTLDYSQAHLPKIIADHRVIVTLKSLPLHLRSHAAVEQILSPYCVMDYVPTEPDALNDLSIFTCLARKEQSACIPSDITIKVNDDGFETFAHGTSEFAIFLSGYTISVAFADYTDGSATDYQETNIAPSSAECFISYSLLDNALISKFSQMIILIPQEGSHIITQENVQSLFEDIPFIRVRVRKLTESAFLLSVTRLPASHTLYTTLQHLLGAEIEAGEITIQPWTPQFGSTGYTAAKSAELEITGLSCHLCVPEIVEYVLSSFSLVKAHITIVDDSHPPHGKEIIVYKCAVWCTKLRYIPRRLKIKQLPLRLADPRAFSVQPTSGLSVIDVDIVKRSTRLFLCMFIFDVLACKLKNQQV